MNDYTIPLALGQQPDMAHDQFVAILTVAGSPAVGEAHAIYSNLLANGGVQPGAFLAFWWVESKFGTTGIQKAYSTRNPGNVRTPEDDTLASGSANTPRGVFALYPSWANGALDWSKRLRGAKYAGKGLTTVRQVVPVYAPKSDNNDPDNYIAAVLARVALWQGARGVTSMVPKPPMISDHTKTKFGGYLRGTRRHVLLVSHISAGTDSLAWLRDEHLDAKNDDISPSVNYLIRRDGVIIEIVDPHGPAPWTNGIDYTKFPHGKKPNLANPLIAELTRQQINPNQWSLTIEHEALAGQGLTPAQWAATTALQAWLCQEFAAEGLVPDAIHLIGHNQIDGIDRPNCPGWTEAQWAKLRGDVAALLGGGAVQPQQPTPKPPAPAPSDPGFPGVVQGDQSLVINGQVVPNGRAVRAERVLMQVLNDQGKQYWISWSGHQWSIWHEGFLPLPPD